jgi:hypothetical protein
MDRSALAVLGLAWLAGCGGGSSPGALASVGPGTKVATFHEHESIALHMMYRYRTAGSFPPDREAALGPRSLAEPIETVIRR